LLFAQSRNHARFHDAWEPPSQALTHGAWVLGAHADGRALGEYHHFRVATIGIVNLHALEAELRLRVHGIPSGY